jgi:hypothetical protein
VQAAWHGPEPTLRRRRPNRLAMAGIVALAEFLVWLVVGRALIDVTGPRPAFVVVGWGVLRDTLQLGGYAPGAFRAGLALLWLAVLLAVLTDGFTQPGGWAWLASALVGLAGALAAAPLLLAAGVIIGNIAVWGLVVLFGMLLTMALCLRILTAPFRRGW